ncbi:DUF4124 domain-containing protein [Azonexus sp.]|uniref:DUF4124 domain-containing protein n=1 Tax=Azonexus sp. TaxID=1872668 RepID=UPI0035B3D110
MLLLDFPFHGRPQPSPIFPEPAMPRFRQLPLLLALGILFCPVAQADAYRCVGAGGRVSISSVPCDGMSRVQRSDDVSADQQRRALSDLERQRKFLRMREREQAASGSYVMEANPHQGTGNAFDPATRDRLHACLMSVTATSGLSAYETGRRRVQCYAGTRGLLDECEMRVTGTAGLTTAQERHLRAQCRSMTGGG